MLSRYRDDKVLNFHLSGQRFITFQMFLFFTNNRPIIIHVSRLLRLSGQWLVGTAVFDFFPLTLRGVEI